MTQDELLALIDQAERKKWKELDLSDKGLTELPPEIGRLTQLEKLDLSVTWKSKTPNQLTHLPTEIGDLNNLLFLDLEGNLFTALPREIAHLSNLKKLYLGKNRFSKLPIELFNLVSLETLSLGHFQEGNQLSILPSEIGNLVNLVNLKLDNIQLEKVPPQIGALINLEELTLNNNSLIMLPSEIGKLKNLSLLDVCGNKLTDLPIELFSLTNLQILDLGCFRKGNVFDIPSAIVHLSGLKRLSLANLQLTSLPQEIKYLSSISELNLHSNQLEKIPDWIGELTSLEDLCLNDNPIEELPLSLFDLPNLKLLWLEMMPNLKHLAPEIGKLTNLQEITLGNTAIKELPTKLGFLPNTRLDLYDNEMLRFPPSEIVALNSEAIKNFLKAVDKNSIKVWESKCLLIGEGGVGKTTLFEVLNNRPYDQYEPGTVGIEIGPLDLLHPEKESVTMRLNCWDFAGQDFNHAMHQFFFSNRALFLLVWNARHGWQQGKLYRWLENIKARAPEAKVILVATHTDQPHSDYPAADLQAKYPQIVDTIEVSSKTGENILELRQLIQKHAVDLPLMGLRWPQTWLDAANAVRALCEAGQKHASRREVIDIMKEHDLNEEECGILMRWLHELGDILHFDDEPEMRGRVILDPEWLTQHIGIVLRSDEVQEQNGILTRQHLNTLWPDLDDYLQDHFLRMMDKFDLAYLIPDDPQDRSLIVERLPLDAPDYTLQWQEFEERGNEISLRFKLGSMQPGIPTWFIARCHRFTMNTHWLNGVLFKDEDDRHRALITADDKDNIVQMTVRGPFPQRFMALLRDGFRDTLKRYKGLEVTRWVPCPGFNELENQPCQNEFRLDSLENWLEQKPERILFHCPECDSELSRLQLVEGIGAAALTQQLTEERMAELLSEAHAKTQKEIKDHIDYRVEDVLKYQQRNFLRAFYLEQDREMVTCPNLFTIRQVPKRGVVKKQEWHIQLYCQQPGAWHPVGEPYIIEEQKEWFAKSLPYLKTLLKVLSVVAPLANAALAITDVVGDKVQVARDQHTIFENEVKMMDDLLKGAKVVAEMERPLGERIHDQPERSTFRKAEGAELVPIRDLMDHLAAIDEQKGRPKWAGLTRRQTPEGDILWLDQEHLQEYLSKRKPVSQPEDVE